MAKFYDVIGFLDEVETAPSVWSDGIHERYYKGDILPNYIRNETQGINDNVVLHYKFSVLADNYARDHIKDIRYVKYLGTKWHVTNVEPAIPRLIITVGGVYNEKNETGA
jgi:hypothetical protein